MKKAPTIMDFKPDEMDDPQKFQGVPNIMRQAAFFETAGFGLSREDFFKITLALGDLVDKNPNIQVYFSGSRHTLSNVKHTFSNKCRVVCLGFVQKFK